MPSLPCLGSSLNLPINKGNADALFIGLSDSQHTFSNLSGLWMDLSGLWMELSALRCFDMHKDAFCERPKALTENPFTNIAGVILDLLPSVSHTVPKRTNTVLLVWTVYWDWFVWKHWIVNLDSSRRDAGCLLLLCYTGTITPISKMPGRAIQGADTTLRMHKKIYQKSSSGPHMYYVFWFATIVSHFFFSELLVVWVQFLGVR